ncbi:MAG: c-type cytochrome biogenesis protein CcmI [Microvirga sp.]
MILWLIFAAMTAAAMLAVLLPLRRRAPARSGSDVAVYRDQLEEVDRDRAAGLVGAGEAEAARVEISRRLIAAAAPPDRAGAPVETRWGRRAAALAGALMLPLGSAALYLALGSPGVPSEPLASRSVAAPAPTSIEAMVAQVEAHLLKNPEDGRGWEVVAPIYLRTGRFDDAVKARRNALRLLGPTAVREADLGQAMVAAADGVVTAEARAAFERAAALDAGDVMARYFFGLAAEQEGKRAEAAAIWRKLLADAPPGARWTATVRAALAQIGEAVAPGAVPPPQAAAPAGPPKPLAEPPGEMILAMVARLAERLKADGSDLDGWVRLVRSYLVLGDQAKAQAALEDGRRALASDPDKLRRLDEAASELGVKS